MPTEGGIPIHLPIPVQRKQIGQILGAFDDSSPLRYSRILMKRIAESAK
jgi:hypothetical protein